MIEFSDIKMAIQAKAGLHGQDIYSGCCSIKCEYARTEKLNVYKVRVHAQTSRLCFL